MKIWNEAELFRSFEQLKAALQEAFDAIDSDKSGFLVRFGLYFAHSPDFPNNCFEIRIMPKSPKQFLPS